MIVLRKNILIFGTVFALSVLCAFPALAAVLDYSIKVGREYETVYDGEFDNIPEVLSMSAEDVKKYFDENSLLFLAVNSDNSSQIKLSCRKDGFSQKTKDFARLDDAALESIAKDMYGKGDCKIEESNKVKYISYLEKLKDSGGSYTSIQYITVKDGKLYQLSFYNSGDEVPLSVDTVFKSFELYGESGDKYFWQKNLILLGIMVFAAIFVITAIKAFRGALTAQKEKSAPEIQARGSRSDDTDSDSSD